MDSLKKKIICTPVCPRPVGPYNQAIVIDRIVYLSGMIGLNAETGKIVKGGIVGETKQTLENIVKMLEKVGSKIDNVIKCTILLRNIADYVVVNDEYSKGKKKTRKNGMKCCDNYANNFCSLSSFLL
jgi:2-iminobutanoate/2-iminopropanoate deaminase